MKFLATKHKTLWSNKSFIILALTSGAFFAGSLFVNYGAVRYATNQVGNTTTDILLDNLPVVNTDIIFSEGALLFVVFLVGLLAWEPKTIPFTVKSMALFICIRAVFVIMTHLGPIPDRIPTDLENFRHLSSGADLFFSGHTGLPFLTALLFWENKYLRWVFLLCSIVAALAVILGHLHYTIDVFSAFFISYGIYRLSHYFFQRDYRLFKHGLDARESI